MSGDGLKTSLGTRRYMYNGERRSRVLKRIGVIFFVISGILHSVILGVGHFQGPDGYEYLSPSLLRQGASLRSRFQSSNHVDRKVRCAAPNDSYVISIQYVTSCCYTKHV